jgi:uncharacterized repeat protein (TIGR03803 family)
MLRSLARLTISIVLLHGSARAQYFEILHSFSGPDGSGPSAGLVQAADGNLYGTTVNGGPGLGTVFRLTLAGEFQMIAAFIYTNGSRPYPGLTLGPDGNLYGVATYGGLTNLYAGLGPGTIFRVTTNGTLTTLAFLNGTNGEACYAQLLLGSDGNFYSGTDEGGTYGSGTYFKVSTAGGLTTLTNIRDFTQGLDPNGPFLEIADGTFIGTTVWGGPSSPAAPYGAGTVFSLTTNGVLNRVAAFDGITGGRPQGIMLADDGNFYGTTMDPEPGTIFRMTPDGTLTALYFFSGWDGTLPRAGPIQASDHFLYGTTSGGGTGGGGFYGGTVFRLDMQGHLETLVSFNGTNGSGPDCRLCQASDGDLYGTTYTGGANFLGTVFRISFRHLDMTNDGSNVILSWPTNTSGLKLQSTDSLLAPNWIDCTNSRTVSGTKFFVTNSASARVRFFRLKK